MTAQFTRIRINLTVGSPVIQDADSLYPKIGWIVDMSDDSIVVRWVAPGYPYSDAKLTQVDLISQPLYRRIVAAAQARLDDGMIRPISLTEELLQGIYEARLTGEISQVTPALVKIAEYFKLPLESCPQGKRVHWQDRELILDTLQVHYPNWRQGCFL